MKRFQLFNRILNRNGQFKGLSFEFLNRKIYYCLFVSLFMMHFTSAIAEEKCSIAGVSDPSEFFSPSFKPIINDVVPDGILLIEFADGAIGDINLNSRAFWLSNRFELMKFVFEESPGKKSDPCYEKFIREFIKVLKSRMAALCLNNNEDPCSEENMEEISMDHYYEYLLGGSETYQIEAMHFDYQFPLLYNNFAATAGSTSSPRGTGFTIVDIPRPLKTVQTVD